MVFIPQSTATTRRGPLADAGRPYAGSRRPARHVDAVGAGGRSRSGADVGLVGVTERTGQGAVVAEVAGEPTGVDPAERGHAVATEVAVEVVVGSPVAATAGHLADDDAPAERPRRLVVVGCGAVVAEVRGGEGDDLPGVGRVADDLLVAGHRRVEHDLAGDDPPSGSAPKSSPSNISPSARTRAPSRTLMAPAHRTGSDRGPIGRPDMKNAPVRGRQWAAELSQLSCPSCPYGPHGTRFTVRRAPYSAATHPFRRTAPPTPRAVVVAQCRVVSAGGCRRGRRARRGGSVWRTRPRTVRPT